jgi:1-deoxy-D-xylulose-5-phosphate reductoisomerase
MKKKIIILGSTGSIGKNTIKIIRNDKKNFSIKLLSTNKNTRLLIKQAKEFNVKHLVINDPEIYKKTINKYKKSYFKFYNNFDCINKILKYKEIHYSMISVIGVDGIYPAIKLIRYSKTIAIVNKESLICGWSLIKKELKKYNTTFIPIDSEHFSIFKLIQNYKSFDIKKIFITASGGPFLNFNKKNLSKVTVKQALKHPNWKMGKKITIDSATMMNKVFEVIEARNIFNLSYRKLSILIHPQSYLHAIVEYNNGLTKMLFHEPDMKIPIFNSLYANDGKKFFSQKINLMKVNNLNLKEINKNQFPLIKIIKFLPNYNSLYETALIVINDFFVFKFLNNKISYIKLINLILKIAYDKEVLDLRKKKINNIGDIKRTIKTVKLKLNSL